MSPTSFSLDTNYNTVKAKLKTIGYFVRSLNLFHLHDSKELLNLSYLEMTMMLKIAKHFCGFVVFCKFSKSKT